MVEDLGGGAEVSKLRDDLRQVVVPTSLLLECAPQHATTGNAAGALASARKVGTLTQERCAVREGVSEYVVRVDEAALRSVSGKLAVRVTALFDVHGEEHAAVVAVTTL
ncbi:hypothetical protein EON67_10130 [archaeon]|nr:MAG: hypothetical protein EON67_10130 [archaeon]